MRFERRSHKHVLCAVVAAVSRHQLNLNQRNDAGRRLESCCIRGAIDLKLGFALCAYLIIKIAQFITMVNTTFPMQHFVAKNY